MKNFIIVPVILLMLNSVQAQYISPGLRVGYDFNSNITLGFKISFGIGFDKQFYNFTFGRKFALNKNSSYQTHNYIDLQSGVLIEPFGKKKVPLFYGGGIGIGFYEENGVRHHFPRITTFAGYFVFTTLDMNIIDWKTIEPDIGLQMVLPIPVGEKPTFGTGG